MRTVALTLALLSSAALGLAGLFQVGVGYARMQHVEQAERFRPHLLTPDVVAGALRERNAAIALLIAAVFAMAGAILHRRAPRGAATLLFCASVLPIPFVLWGLCPAAPAVIAAVLCILAQRAAASKAPADN